MEILSHMLNTFINHALDLILENLLFNISYIQRNSYIRGKTPDPHHCNMQIRNETKTQ